MPYGSWRSITFSICVSSFHFQGEDATEDAEENPFATASLAPEHEHLYVDDPKKALKGFYEREGMQIKELCSVCQVNSVKQNWLFCVHVCF